MMCPSLFRNMSVYFNATANASASLCQYSGFKMKRASLEFDKYSPKIEKILYVPKPSTRITIRSQSGTLSTRRLSNVLLPTCRKTPCPCKGLPAVLNFVFARVVFGSVFAQFGRVFVKQSDIGFFRQKLARADEGPPR